MNTKKTLLSSLIISYFITYSSFGFGVVIDVGFLPWQLLTILIINFVLLFIVIKIPIISKHFIWTLGFKTISILLLLTTLSLHIFSAIMGKKLGPTLIKLSEQQTLSTTNLFLIKINILVILVIFSISLIVGYMLDKKFERNNIIQKYIYFILIILLFAIFTYILWPILSFLNLLYGLSTGG